MKLIFMILDIVINTITRETQIKCDSKYTHKKILLK